MLLVVQWRDSLQGVDKASRKSLFLVVVTQY